MQVEVESSLDGDPSVSSYKGSPEHICYELQPGSGEHYPDRVSLTFWTAVCLLTKKVIFTI